MTMPKEPDPGETGRAFAIAQIGLEMVAPIGIGLALDYYLGTLPWVTVVCAVVGFVGGMIHLVLVVQDQDVEERRKPPGDSAK